MIFPLVATLLFAPLWAQENNPFTEMAGKSYIDYFEYLDRDIYKLIDRRDAAEAASIAAQMREAAKIAKNKKLLLEADFYEESYRFSHEVLMRKPEQAIMDSLGAIFTHSMANIAQSANFRRNLQGVGSSH